jgi:hypothetical protein
VHLCIPVLASVEITRGSHMLTNYRENIPTSAMGATTLNMRS